MEALPTYFIECSLLLAAIVFLYRLYSPYNYWKKLGVPFMHAKYPVIGDIAFVTQPQVHLANKWYNHFPKEKFYGTFLLWRPALVVKDPELAENLLIKDFSHAYNRSQTVDLDTNILSKHLINQRDEKWKRLRSKLTPTFSSGKLKSMHSQLLKCGDNLVKYLDKNLGDIQVKDLFGRFSMDVVTTIAFGLDLDIINNPNNQFYEIGKTAFGPSRYVRYFFNLQPFLSSLYKILGANLVSNSMEKFFYDAVNQTLEYRQKNNVSRSDYLNLLTELERKDEELMKNGKIDPNDVFDKKAVISNAFIFFAAGYETTGTTLSFFFYEIAMNPEVQEKLYQEITTVLSKHNGELSYEAVGELQYMEQAFNETMRRHPPLISADRVISKEYRIPGTDLILPVGTPLIIQIYGMHHDPQYFPEPEKFKPERFDPERNEIIKGTYLPFGAGPRVCIASRFAKLEMAVCAAKVLKEFKVKRSLKTVVPLKYDPTSFLLTPENGEMWLTFEKRSME